MKTKNETAKQKKTLLYCDEATYILHKEKEDILIEAYTNLEAIAKKYIKDGTTIDYNQLLDAPLVYLSEIYWMQISKESYPESASREKIFLSTTDVNVQDLHDNEVNFWKYYKEIADKYKPIIKATGVFSTLSKSCFDKYLDPSKKKHYNAVKRFLNAANNLKKYGGTNGGIHLVRFCQNLNMQGLDALISDYDFIEKKAK